MRAPNRLLAALFAACLVATAALAGDEAAFKSLKADYDKLAKNKDDAANRERRKVLLRAFDFLDLKSCKKLLRDAYGDEALPDGRVAAVTMLAASGDTKEIDFLLTAFKKEKHEAPQIAFGEGLGYTPEAAAAGVSKHLSLLLPKHKGTLQRSLLEGLSEIRDPTAYTAILNLGEKLPVPEAYERLVALGSTGKEQAVPVLTRSVVSTIADLRLGAATGLARTTSPEATETLKELLADADPRVVTEAATALAGLRPESAKDALIAALGSGSYRSKEAVREALEAITGKDCGHAPEAWKTLTPGALPKPPAFAGIPVASDRVVLVLDLSRSMDWSGRLARAKEELKLFLASLPETASFDVIAAARTPTAFAGKLVPAATQKQAALDWIDKQLTGGGCDVREAVLFATRTLTDADTVLLATDSYPFGDTSEDTPLAVVQELRRENRIRRIVLHAAFVAPGGRHAENETDAAEYEDRKELVKLLAETLGGKFVALE